MRSVFLSLVLMIPACGGTTTSTPSPDGGGADAGGACNTLATEAPENTDHLATGTMPSGQGGTIVDGTYVVTSSDLYPGGTGATQRTAKDTLMIAGSVIQLRQVDALEDTTATGTVRTSGNAITVAFTCPSSIAGTTSTVTTYTATPTTLTLFDQAKRRVSSYTKK